MEAFAAEREITVMVTRATTSPAFASADDPAWALPVTTALLPEATVTFLHKRGVMLAGEICLLRWPTLQGNSHLEACLDLLKRLNLPAESPRDKIPGWTPDYATNEAVRALWSTVVDKRLDPRWAYTCHQYGQHTIGQYILNAQNPVGNGKRSSNTRDMERIQTRLARYDLRLHAGMLIVNWDPPPTCALCEKHGHD